MVTRKPIQIPVAPIWERREGEWAKAFEAFACYRDMGSSRSTEKVRLEVGKSSRLIERWSAAHDWVDRVRAYDIAMDRARTERAFETNAQARARVIQDATFIQKRLMTRFARMSDAELVATPLKDLLRAWDIGMKAERLSRGESTENVQVELTGEMLETIVTELIAPLLRTPEDHEHVREKVRELTQRWAG